MDQRDPAQFNPERSFEPNEDRSPTSFSKTRQSENHKVSRWSTSEPFIHSSPTTATLGSSYPARTAFEAITHLESEEPAEPINYSPDFPDFQQREPQGAYVNYGKIYNIAEPSLFSCFRLDEDVLVDATKPNFRSGRRNTAFDSVMVDILNEKYVPYAKVENKMIRRILFEIVDILHFLDTGFAEYFRIVIPPSDCVTARLTQIREAIHSKQPCNNKYVSKFGIFIHMIDDAKKTEGHNLARPFRPSDSGDDALAYLQEALEIPYWSLIANVFSSSCATGSNSETSIAIVLRVVNDCTRQIRALLQYAKEVCECDFHPEIEEGIKRRLKILDHLIDDAPRRLVRSGDPQLQLLPQASVSSVAKSQDALPLIAQLETPVLTREPSNLDRLQQSLLFIAFFVAALLPAFSGFARQYILPPDRGGTGSAFDPDWVWMLSNFIVTVPGNVYCVIPLLITTKGTNEQRLTWLTWICITLSIACGIASLVTYSFINRCWTSSLTFIGNLLTTAFVFITTQKANESLMPKPNARDLSKVKND